MSIILDILLSDHNYKDIILKDIAYFVKDKL